jgi:predicted DNA-binding protein
MPAISLNLPPELLSASDQNAESLGVSRAAYIRRAIEQLNAATHAELRDRRMAEASKRVRDESMRVNAEFDALDASLLGDE